MIKINGIYRISYPDNLLSLIEALGYRQERIAVEINGNIIKRDLYQETTISDGDKIEIVCFVGGG